MSISSKKLGAICVDGQLVKVGSPIVIPISAIDDRLLAYESSGKLTLVRRGDSCKEIMN